jgi:hypothetical protein
MVLPMRFLPLTSGLCLLLAACATPENRRELTGPYYPYKPIPYKAPTPGEPLTSPNETTVWYGPDTLKRITGRWGMGGHRPDLNYPDTPPGIEQRVISRINPKGLRAQEIADRELGLNYAVAAAPRVK